MLCVVMLVVIVCFTGLIFDPSYEFGARLVFAEAIWPCVFIWEMHCAERLFRQHWMGLTCLPGLIDLFLRQVPFVLSVCL